MVFFNGILLWLRSSDVAFKHLAGVKLTGVKFYTKGRFTGRGIFDLREISSAGIIFLPAVSYFYSQNCEGNSNFAVEQKLVNCKKKFPRTFKTPLKDVKNDLNCKCKILDFWV